MRLLIPSIAVLMIAGCASGPATTPVSTPPASPASVVASAAAAAPADGVALAPAVKTYPGYKMKQKDGATVYCKKVAKVGSRFEDEYCLTAAELDQLNAKAEEDRQQFRRNQTICGTGGCGGS